MSDKTNNGGPAFPGVRIEAGDNYNHPKKIYRVGMTLRDYFAAKAMPLAFQYWRECTNGVDGDFVFSRTEDEGEMDLIAADCYQMADAMLKARGQA